MLKPFLIRDLHEDPPPQLSAEGLSDPYIYNVIHSTGLAPKRRNGLVQLSAADYDEIAYTHPQARLTYLDDDDGDIITVGSALELAQRLEDPHLPSTETDVPDTIHLFDIRRSKSVIDLWKKFESNLPLDLLKDTQNADIMTAEPESVQSSVEEVSSLENMPTQTVENDTSEPFLSAFEAEMSKMLSDSHSSSENTSPDSTPSSTTERAETSPGSTLDANEVFTFAMRNFIKVAELIGSGVRSKIPELEQHLENIQASLPANVADSMHNTLSRVEDQVRAMATSLNSIPDWMGQELRGPYPGQFPSPHEAVRNLQAMGTQLGVMGQTLLDVFETGIQHTLSAAHGNRADPAGVNSTLDSPSTEAESFSSTERSETHDSLYGASQTVSPQQRPAEVPEKSPDLEQRMREGLAYRSNQDFRAQFRGPAPPGSHMPYPPPIPSWGFYPYHPPRPPMPHPPPGPPPHHHPLGYPPNPPPGHPLHPPPPPLPPQPVPGHHPHPPPGHPWPRLPRFRTSTNAIPNTHPGFGNSFIPRWRSSYPPHPSSGSLFIGNVGFNVSEKMISDVFLSKGYPVVVTLLRDFRTGRHAGFGYVNFSAPEMATAAMQDLQGMLIDGHSINLEYVDHTPVTSLPPAVPAKESGAPLTRANPQPVGVDNLGSSANIVADSASSSDSERFNILYPSLMPQREPQQKKKGPELVPDLLPGLSQTEPDFPPVSQEDAHMLAGQSSSVRATAIPPSSGNDTNPGEVSENPFSENNRSSQHLPGSFPQDTYDGPDLEPASARSTMHTGTAAPFPPHFQHSHPHPHPHPHVHPHFQPHPPAHFHSRHAATLRSNHPRRRFPDTFEPVHPGIPHLRRRATERHSLRNGSQMGLHGLRHRSSFHQFSDPIAPQPPSPNANVSQGDFRPQQPPAGSSSRQHYIDTCVSALTELGYGSQQYGGPQRMAIYAAAANGELVDAIEMIEEERKAYQQRRPSGSS